MKSIVRNKKGFTLAELLIVVAIIGVLVAVSIPIFTGQLKKARIATNQANARAAYAAAVAKRLDDKETGAKAYVYTVSSATVGTPIDADTTGVKMSETPISNWNENTNVGINLGEKLAGTWTISFSADAAETVYIKGAEQ